MAKIVIALLMITIAFLIVLLLVIISLSIALLVFSRKGNKRQDLLNEKGAS
jgi:hypothetical protein